jgi:hypothetical protein
MSPTTLGLRPSKHHLIDIAITRFDWTSHTQAMRHFQITNHHLLGLSISEIDFPVGKSVHRYNPAAYPIQCQFNFQHSGHWLVMSNNSPHNGTTARKPGSIGPNPFMVIQFNRGMSPVGILPRSVLETHMISETNVLSSCATCGFTNPWMSILFDNYI